MPVLKLIKDLWYNGPMTTFEHRIKDVTKKDVRILDVVANFLRHGVDGEVRIKYHTVRGEKRIGIVWKQQDIFFDEPYFQKDEDG